MTTQTQPASPPRTSEAEDKLAYFQRWLRVWIALLVVATLTVAVFLVIIAVALSKVNSNVAAAQQSVRAVRANTSILPGQVNTINSQLAAIDQNLKAIPGQVEQINSGLSSVNSSLTDTDASLADTANRLNTTESSLVSTNEMLGAIDSSLVNTSGSLKDTSSLLVSVQGLANTIEAVLEDAESPGEPNNPGEPIQGPSGVTGPQRSDPLNDGAEGIFQRVAVANQPLMAANQDTTDILNRLVSVNGHLNSVCEALVPQTLALLDGGVDCEGSAR